MRMDGSSFTWLDSAKRTALFIDKLPPKSKESAKLSDFLIGGNFKYFI